MTERARDAVLEPLTAGIGLRWWLLMAVIAGALGGFETLDMHSVQRQQLSQGTAHALSGQTAPAHSRRRRRRPAAAAATDAA